MTDAPPGEKDEDDVEAVAAFTTPLVMISLILFTAPGQRRKKHQSTSMISEDITSWLMEDKAVVLTVNKLSSLSLDVKIQRPVPVWREQKGCVNINIT